MISILCFNIYLVRWCFRSNTVLMHYDGGSSGYGSGGSLVNTLFPKYKHHKLNLNSLKNYG